MKFEEFPSQEVPKNPTADMINSEGNALENVRGEKAQKMLKAIGAISGRALLAATIGLGSMAPYFAEEAHAGEQEMSQGERAGIKERAKEAFGDLEKELSGKPSSKGPFGEMEQELQRMRERQKPAETQAAPSEKNPVESSFKQDIPQTAEQKEKEKILLDRALGEIQKKLSKIDQQDGSWIKNESLRSSYLRNQELLKKQLRVILQNPEKYAKTINIERETVVFSGSYMEEAQGIQFERSFDHVIKFQK